MIVMYFAPIIDKVIVVFTHKKIDKVIVDCKCAFQ